MRQKCVKICVTAEKLRLRLGIGQRGQSNEEGDANDNLHFEAEKKIEKMNFIEKKYKGF